MKQQQKMSHQLTITASSIVSTDDPNFSTVTLNSGDVFEPTEVYFSAADGRRIDRETARNRGEQHLSRQTLPRLVCQIFERQISELSQEDREQFPICQYLPNGEIIRGIFTSEAEFRRKCRNSLEFVRYWRGDIQFFLYCWNVFSTLTFAQECLKRFGTHGDSFILFYRHRNDQESTQEIEITDAAHDQQHSYKDSNNYVIPYSYELLQSKNIIFRGAPGTGKSYLAKQIAADIVSNGAYNDWNSLTIEQKERVEFIQFHPSYDYTDFIEGFRPSIDNADSTATGNISFTLHDGQFKRFLNAAIENSRRSEQSPSDIQKENIAHKQFDDYFKNYDYQNQQFTLPQGNTFYIKNVTDEYIKIYVPNNDIVKELQIRKSDVLTLLEADRTFKKGIDVTAYLKHQSRRQEDSYEFVLVNDIRSKQRNTDQQVPVHEALQPYVFIIDEINRGEISKIFGEAFFSLDPGYRGVAGQVYTQYGNKLYVPDNVYIIGTMNDIDRSVDSFDFAMRRRFRFIEIKAQDRLNILDSLGVLKNEAVARMTSLNKEISSIDGLSDDYHVGPAYFLNLHTNGSRQDKFNILWENYLQPLLHDYIRGMVDEDSIMKRFAKAYQYDARSSYAQGGDDDNGQNH